MLDTGKEKVTTGGDTAVVAGKPVRGLMDLL
jgi:hypothetical protein